MDAQGEGMALLKQLLKTHEFQALKKENRGFFYKAQDDLCRTSKSCRDLEYLKRCLQYPGETITALLFSESGFRLSQVMVTVKQ